MQDESQHLTVDSLARVPPVFEDLLGTYDWRLQRRDYGAVQPLAYKMSTQTFASNGQPKDTDKDYDK